MDTVRPRNIRSVGHVELRSHLPEIVGRLSADEPALALTNRNRVEAIILSPTAFDRLAGADEERQRVLDALPILVAAVSTGVAFPSESLRGLLGSDLNVDWRRMNAFQASFPLATTHDDEGQLLATATGPLEHREIPELDDELRYT